MMQLRRLPAESGFCDSYAMELPVCAPLLPPRTANADVSRDINDPSGCGKRALLPDLAETLHARFIAARITD